MRKIPALSFSGVTSLGPFWLLIRKEIKTQTCRMPRKKPIKKGDILFLYWRQRQSKKLKAERGEPHKIGVAKCVKVERMKYRDFAFNSDFARRDGFASSIELRQWFGNPEFFGDEEYDVIHFQMISSPDIPPIFPGILHTFPCHRNIVRFVVNTEVGTKAVR